MQDLNVYEFKLFQTDARIVHGVFARSGGVSKGAFDSLNIGMNSGDDPAAISENRERIHERMGRKPLVLLNQVHGTKIKLLKKADADLSSAFEPYAGDGIVTDMKNVLLVIQVADCQSVMLYDPENQVIANVHSGWRGSVSNIIGKCVDQMVSGFGSRPENILAGISPSLGPCCAEFIHYKVEIPKHLWSYKIKDTNYFNFWEMSVDQLRDRGVKKEHIENMAICTLCHTELFYSYRHEKTTGRFACAIAMNGPSLDSE